MSIVRVGSAEAGSPWMIWRCALFFPLLLTSCLNQLKLWLEALELALIERGNFIFIARDYSDRDRESSTGKQAWTYIFTEISDLLSTHTGRHGFACRGFCIIRYDLCTKRFEIQFVDERLLWIVCTSTLYSSWFGFIMNLTCFWDKFAILISILFRLIVLSDSNESSILDWLRTHIPINEAILNVIQR